MKVLFVCLGNICRSPAAQGVMEHLLRLHHLEDQVQVDSAGLGSWHVGELADRRMRAAATKRGYSLTHRARQVKADDFNYFDLIIGMDDENCRQLRRLAPSPHLANKVMAMASYFRSHPTFTDVPDPYYSSDEHFTLVLELLEDGCTTLLDSLR